MGVLLALAAVLVVVCVLLIGFFGVRRSFCCQARPNLRRLGCRVGRRATLQDAALYHRDPRQVKSFEGNGTAAEGPSGAVDDNSPHTTDMSCDNITLQDAVLDIDYGRLTIVIDPRRHQRRPALRERV